MVFKSLTYYCVHEQLQFTYFVEADLEDLLYTSKASAYITWCSAVLSIGMVKYMPLSDTIVICRYTLLC